MKLQSINRYESYKDSGVEWLDKMPTEWRVAKIKSICSHIRDGTHGSFQRVDEGYPLLSVRNIVNSKFVLLPDDSCISKSDYESILKSIKIKEGDLQLAIVGATLGKVALVPENMPQFVTQRSLATLRTIARFLYNRFLFYFASSSYFQDTLWSRASYSAQPGIYLYSIANIDIFVPFIQEQMAISAYLDTKTAQIDRKIDLLSQKAAQYGKLKQSLINETVTRGLDKTVAMKDSGVEWIGEVPEHWDVKRIKDITLVKRGASPRPIDDPIYFNEEGEYSWVRIADLTASERYLLNTKEKLSSLGASLSVKRYPDDFILSIAGTVGKPIITKIKCCIHDGFVWFPTLKINPEFLYYIFSTGLPYQGLGKLGTQLNLNTETVGFISIPLPSVSEIESIVDYLDEKTAHIDRIVATINSQIDKLKELRKTLINDVVTGKIKVA